MLWTIYYNTKIPEPYIKWPYSRVNFLSLDGRDFNGYWEDKTENYEGWALISDVPFVSIFITAVFVTWLNSLEVGRKFLSPRIKCSGLKLTTHNTLVPRFRMSGGTTPPPHVSMTWCLIKHCDTFSLTQLWIIRRGIQFEQNDAHQVAEAGLVGPLVLHD